jgi:hypothetical protein
MGKLPIATRREEGDGKEWRGRFGRLLDRPAIFPIRASSMPSRAGVDHPPPPRLWRTSSSFGSAICQSDGQIGAHAPELIIFPRGGKTDWGKKRGIFGDFFWGGEWPQKSTARQAATKDELPRKIAKITKTEEYKLLSLCSLRSFVARILF